MLPLGNRVRFPRRRWIENPPASTKAIESLITPTVS